MIYSAVEASLKGWRIRADWTSSGGELRDVCGAENQAIAEETARLMNEYAVMAKGKTT